ncbi:MAG TPA: hypothetical protein VGG08_02050 [Solirubrobacteraceae bacterium]
MAKLARESKLRERRAAKQARKDARKYLAENPVAEDELVAPVDPAEAIDGEQPDDPEPSVIDVDSDVGAAQSA